MFKYAIKFNSIIFKRIQYYYSKYVHKPSLSHIHIYHQIKYPNITKFTYHISYTHNNHIIAYIQTSHNTNVTQCKTRDSMHVVPNVNPMFHRFPIQCLESKPRSRSGQDQSQHAYFQLRITSATPISIQGSTSLTM